MSFLLTCSFYTLLYSDCLDSSLILEINCRVFRRLHFALKRIGKKLMLYSWQWISGSDMAMLLRTKKTKIVLSVKIIAFLSVTIFYSLLNVFHEDKYEYDSRECFEEFNIYYYYVLYSYIFYLTNPRYRWLFHSKSCSKFEHSCNSNMKHLSWIARNEL